MAGRLTIVGLGPAGPELITPQVTERLAAAPTVRLRTAQHPAAAVVDAPSYDHVYEAADRFADVYEEIARDLLELAAVDDLVYAVPGSPLVLERSVELVREAATDMDLELEILPAVSFLDTVWSRLQVDPIEAGIRLVDGHVFATAAAGQTGPLLVAHAHANHVLSDIKLAFEEPPAIAIILQRLGLPDDALVGQQRVATAQILGGVQLLVALQPPVRSAALACGRCQHHRTLALGAADLRHRLVVQPLEVGLLASGAVRLLAHGQRHGALDGAVPRLAV